MEFLCCYTRLTLKEVDRVERNRWTESIGMSGQGRAEQVDRVVRNTHKAFLILLNSLYIH